MTVASRFETFLNNIALTDAQRTAGGERREAVVSRLNQNYYGSTHKTSNSLFIGSWGKQTRIRPPRDVDVLYLLPPSVYERFQQRTGNRQSQLLQEVKGVLSAAYPYTNIKGDGPAVIVPFTAYNVELIPAFKLQNGQYWICITTGGGSYKAAAYDAETKQIADSSTATSGNTRNLIRMMKCWQGYCNVPIKSFWLEIVAVEFLNSWQYRDKGKTYYDYMVRDFLNHLHGQRNTYIYAPGTYESMYLGDGWATRAKTAYDRAVRACELEPEKPLDAGTEWQKIFGTDIPRSA